MVIKVERSGDGATCTVIGHADHDAALLARLGLVAEVKRGGNCVPSRLPLRAAFKIVRRTLGSRSARVRAWTRTWPCEWTADLRVNGGPVLGGFQDRAAAIQAEEDWLRENWL